MFVGGMVTSVQFGLDERTDVDAVDPNVADSSREITVKKSLYPS